MCHRLERPKTYLDFLQHLMKKFILARIVCRPICRPLREDTKEIRQSWADQLGWIVVSSIIETIHNPTSSEKHSVAARARNIDEIWDQAEESLKRFAIEDIKLHPNEGLRDRFPRWAEKFNRPMPRHPEFKKIPGTDHLKPHRLVALERYRFAEEFLLELQQRKDSPGIDELKAIVQQAFPDIAAEDRNYLSDEIFRNRGRLSSAKTIDQGGYSLALAVAARSLGVKNYETFERHYISGAVDESEILDRAVKSSGEDTNS